MNISYKNKLVGILKGMRWWFFFIISALWSFYAFYMGTLELLSLLGMPVDARQRAVPVMFVFHALFGGIVLFSGILQFNWNIRTKYRKFHRWTGRTYVVAVWISGIGGLTSAVFFDVNIAARIIFVTLAILWISSTTIAYLRARKREFEEHREWMIRSFALTLFNVTGSFWMPGMVSTSLPEPIAYPLGVFLGWFLNLIVAEIWIRSTRRKSSARTLTDLANKQMESVR